MATVAALIVALGASVVMAQARQRGQRGDPAQMRQRMMERYQENMGASEEEWKAIQPLLDKVLEKQGNARVRGRFGMMGRGNRPGAATRPRSTRTTPLGKATAELSTALESESTPAAEIKAKLKALRDARKKAEAELKKARQDLRKVLTPRQEGQMVMAGILD